MEFKERKPQYPGRVKLKKRINRRGNGVRLVDKSICLIASLYTVFICFHIYYLRVLANINMFLKAEKKCFSSVVICVIDRKRSLIII